MELNLLQRQKELEFQLPHVYGSKFYLWQRGYIDSEKRVNLICSANQIGKSSIAIRRVIRNATDKEIQKKLYKREPKMFWYFYPDSATLDREFKTKWEAEWLPRGAMKEHPVYGWHTKKDKGIVSQLHFNTGVSIYFQFYTKSVSNLQAGTVDDITVDEELPMDLYSEIMFRLAASDGIFNMVCTPTLNQLYWKQAMETEDVLPMALKLNVSMYDCLVYEDGSPSTVWTKEKIREVELKCKSETEVQRRVHGKFVTEEGRTFFAFEPTKNFCEPRPLTNCHIYASVDYGSGGDGGHPAAIVFIAVEPDYTKGYIFKAWRGDGITTTAGDVLEQYKKMSKGLRVTLAWYDPAAKDFGVLAERSGVNFLKADKSRDAGEDILNTLFRNQMLFLFSRDGEIEKLAGELMGMMQNVVLRSKRGDDLADATRYGVIGIPWNFESVALLQMDASVEVVDRQMTEEELLAEQIRLRRGEWTSGAQKEPDSWSELEQEIAEWNSYY